MAITIKSQQNTTKHGADAYLQDMRNLQDIMHTYKIALTYFGLVMPYGIKDLGQHWFR